MAVAMKYPDGTRGKRTQQLLPPAANGAVEAVTLSSAHDRAPSLRLHRTVPAVEGGAATVRPSLVVMAFCLLLVLLALWMG